MSLVNDMLCDLEERSARASEPLAGVRPVRRVPEPTPSRPIVVASFFVLISGAALFGLNRHNAVETMPVAVVEPAQAAAAPAAVPDDAAIAILHRSRLDYRLSTTPAPRPPSPARAAPAPVAAEAPRVASGVSAVSEVTHSVESGAQSEAAGGPTGRRRVVRTGVDTGAESETAGNDTGRTRVTRTRVDPAVRLRNAGLAALQRGHAVEAERHFRELVALDPSQSESHLLLHRALVAQSRRADAQAVLSAALEVSDEPARIASVLAHSLLNDGDGDAAQSLLEQYSGAGGADLEYVSLLAAVYERNGEYERAADSYVYLVSRRPEHGAWWIGLAIATDALGREGEARKAYERASRSRGLDPALARYATERLRSMDTPQ